jgi:hypothetical protein
MRIIKEIPAVEFSGCLILSPVGESEKLYCRILNSDITVRIEEEKITQFLINIATETHLKNHGLFNESEIKKNEI